MKKVLVFLLTLGFVASAYAIDLGNGLTLTGEVKTGVRVLTQADNNDDTEDTRVQGYNNDAGQILRNRLTFAYDSDLGGGKIRLEGLGYDTSGYFYEKYAYAWANFLEKKIVVYGGHIGDDLWGLGKLSINVFDPSLDAVKGVRVAFNVVDGLSFGFALPFDSVTYGTWSNNAWSPRTSDGGTLGSFFGRAVIGGVYKSDLVSGAATLRLYPEIDSKVFGGTPNAADKYALYKGYVDAIAGVEIHPIDPLKIVVDSRFDTRKFDKNADGNIQAIKIGSTRVGVRANYELGALTFHLFGDIRAQNGGSAKKGDSAKSQSPQSFYIDDVMVTKDDYVDYVKVETLGDMSLAFRLGGDYKVSDTVGAYLQIGSDNVLWLAGDIDIKNGVDRPGNGIYVKLGGKITLGSSSIEIFDKVNGLGAADREYYKNQDIETYSSINNQFQIDFNWSF
jgi:hypothetical protein